MQALITIIKGEFQQKINSFWDEIESHLGIIAVEPKLLHFSWFGAENFQVEKIGSLLKEKLPNKFSFGVKCGGLSLFPNQETIFYIPIVVTKELLDLHNKIYNEVISITTTESTKLNEYYLPGNWVPHITLIQNKKTNFDAGLIYKKFSLLNLYFKFQITNFSIVDEKGTILSGLDL